MVSARAQESIKFWSLLSAKDVLSDIGHISQQRDICFDEPLAGDDANEAQWLRHGAPVQNVLT